jgi:hypothetical protein
MNPILHLLLSHFISDYPLQSGALVKMKLRSVLGVFLHCLINLLVLIIVLSPFLRMQKVWIVIAVIFATHFVIDEVKIILDKKYPGRRLAHYFIDQIIHIAIIACLSIWLAPMSSGATAGLMSLYYDQSFVSYILILVLVTYFYDITRHFVLTRKTPTPYKRDYRMMLQNAFIVSIAFAVYWIAY